MRCLNNAPQIGRVDTKMSKEFQDDNSRTSGMKYLSEQELDEIEEVDSNISDAGEESSDEANVIDHIYHSSNRNITAVETASSHSHNLKQQDLTSSAVTSGGCQTLESEVKFIKEWLILHTDLIQQQNDDILDKDREIYLLRKENEMLRERILCIEKGIPTQFTLPLLHSGTSSSSSSSVPLLNHHHSNNHLSNCDQNLNSSEQQQKPVDAQPQPQLSIVSGSVGVLPDMTQGPRRPCNNNNSADYIKQNTNTCVAQEGSCVLEDKGSAPYRGSDALAKAAVETRKEAEVKVDDLYHQQEERNALQTIGCEDGVTGCEEVIEEEEDDEFEENGSFSAETEAASEAALPQQQPDTDSSPQLEALAAAVPSDLVDTTAALHNIPTHVSYSITIGGEGSTGGDTLAAATAAAAFLGQEPTGTGSHRPHRVSRRPSRGLKMSIRRKRVSSGGSDNHRHGAAAATTTTSPTVADPVSPSPDVVNHHTDSNTYHQRRYKKKKRRATKDVQMLTTTEPYVTQAHEVNFGIALPDPDIPDSPATLEVPRWRHKIYASLYSMEGTENLDDEVFNKRHLRLENDERRRKRWDVQRIREQRVIEKLKQRQERANFGYCGGGDSGSGAGAGGGIGNCHLDHDQKHQLHSLWPSLDDVRFLEVCDRLPVAAFGHAMPRMQPSEFSLPWLTNPSYLQRRPTSQQMARRSQIRRRNSKR